MTAKPARLQRAKKARNRTTSRGPCCPSAFTTSSTYRTGTGTLQMYSTRPAPSAWQGGETRYYTARYGSCYRIDTPIGFIAGASASRNAHRLDLKTHYHARHDKTMQVETLGKADFQGDERAYLIPSATVALQHVTGAVLFAFCTTPRDHFPRHNLEQGL